jgi:hypothetical protein
MQLVKATYGSPDRPLRIGELEIQCYVLEDGRRVLVQGAMISALGMSQGGTPKKGSGDRLARFAAGKGLEPHISAELFNLITGPIKFRIPGKSAIAYGYEATILAEICEAVLKARADGRLQKQQEHIARQCEILVRGFARVGIIALVDEATGYQEARDRDALHRILEAYISKELLPWTKRFPDEFYAQLFRLMGWQYSPLSVKRPQYVGKLTNEIVYDRLPDGVLEELRNKNPVIKDGRRAHKHHQFLTVDIGNPHLERHLAVVTALMRASSNWLKFKRLLERAVPKPNVARQQEMWPEDDNLDDEPETE